MRPITRRHLLKLSAASAIVVSIGGCDEDQVRRLAIIAIVIGGLTLRFGDPALRVLGITLMVSGHLVVEYLKQDGDQVKETFNIAKDVVERLLKDRKVTLKRADDKEETFPIGDVDYGPNK